MAFHKYFYAVYGVPLPDGQYDTDLLDQQLKGTGCNYLISNQATDPTYFLVVEGEGGEIKPGQYWPISDEAFADPAIDRWDNYLTQGLTVLGITPGHDPAWLFIADES